MPSDPSHRTVGDVSETMIGADSSTLEVASARFSERADLLATVGPALFGLFGTTAWTGGDADAFESDLHGSIIPRLEHISAELRAAATALTTNATEQREASGASSSGGSCPAPFLPPARTPSDPTLPEDRPMSSQYVGITGEVGVGPDRGPGRWQLPHRVPGQRGDPGHRGAGGCRGRRRRHTGRLCRGRHGFAGAHQRSDGWGVRAGGAAAGPDLGDPRGRAGRASGRPGNREVRRRR